MPDEQGEPVKIFVAGNCGPCQEIKQKVAEGKFNQSQVDLIDVETDEGFPYIEKLGLTQVPTAMKGGQKCDLSVEDDTLIIKCPGDDTAGG